MHKITITVVDGSRGGRGGGRKRSINQEEQKEKKPLTYRLLHLDKGIKAKMQKEMGAVPIAGFMAGIGIAKQLVRGIIDFRISDIGRRHGDSNYQAIVGRRMEIAGDVLSVGGAAIAGAAAGSMFGPKGALAGAAVGALGATINIGFRQADRQRAYAHQMFTENNSQAYGLARANFSALTGRLR